jgi:glycosyltransferase involved in cell wall biosynthesis
MPEYALSPHTNKRVLVLCDHYPPGSEGGGGTWLVANIVERLSDRYDFFIITRKCLSRTSTVQFSEIKLNEWNSVGRAQVYYLPPKEITAKRIASIIEGVKPNGVFLNSVFSTPTVKFLISRKIKSSLDIPVVVSPCGELSVGALSIKSQKKRLFLSAAKAIGLYRGLLWRASSELEADEILKVFGSEAKTIIAPDLPPKEILPNFASADKPKKTAGEAKLIFFSRIDRKKNLGFLLERLASIRDGKVMITIVGPVGDDNYWHKCREAIGNLPFNIEARVTGPVSYFDGLRLLTEHHFFVLPTLGENFGYVILEALAAGSPVVISDRTFWNGVAESNAGWTISLDTPRDWDAVLTNCIAMSELEFLEMSRSARALAVEWLHRAEIETAMAELFEKAFGK